MLQRSNASRKFRTTFRVFFLIVVICALLLTGLSQINVSQPNATVHAASGPPNMGINLSGPCDYCGDFIFADAMKAARRWGSTGTPWDGVATVDANGWPTQDAGAVVITPPGNFNIGGTYKLSFTGQAQNINGVASTITVQNKTYNSSTNTTTADLVVGNGSQLYIAFSGTKRNPSDNVGTGLTNVKIMLPKDFNNPSAGNYDPSVTFTDQIKNFVRKFTTIRFMDFTHTNGNLQVNWSDRRLPTYFAQTADLPGASWEYAIQLCNEAGVDAYINIPVKATDNYIRQLALLLKYGSDANGTVYTSTQTNPFYKPLNSNLRLYVEFSNELWNFGPYFDQSRHNYEAAKAEVAAGNSPLNYDGETNDFYWGWRRAGKRLHDTSEIFRSVFGDSAMPNNNGRIRPVLEWQYANAQDSGRQALKFLDDYYNNADGIQHVSNPHPINYFIWGGGGAAYSGVKDPKASSIDAIYNSGYDTSVVPGTINTDVFWGRAYGLMHTVAYEGGFQIGSDSPTDLQIQANVDPRAKQMEIDTQTKFNQAGGELLMYFNAFSYQYGLAVPTVYNQNTPKMQAIDQLRQSTVAEPNKNGTALPATVTLNSGNFRTSARFDTLVYSASAATYTPTLNLVTVNSNNTIQVLVNNVVVQTITTQKSSQQSSDVTLNAISLPAGISAISFKALNPTDSQLNTLKLTSGGTSPTPTPTPGTTPTPTPTPNPGGGTGLKGDYYNTIDLSGSVALSRTDAQVNFDWSTGSPGSGVNTDNFSVRWTGQVQATVSGNYTFTTISDDGIRLWINGQQVINNWTDHYNATDTSAAISLTAGQKVDVKLEYYDHGAGAVAKLQWTPPGGSLVAIPQSQLYPSTGSSTSNLALNKPVTVTGGAACASGEEVAKAVDGSSTSKWCQNGNGNGPYTLQVDLGSSRSLTGFALTHAGSGGESTTYNTSDYQIQVSADGSSWTSVVTITGNTANATNHTISATSARYVRLTISKAQSATTFYAARIYEFQVLGS